MKKILSIILAGIAFFAATGCVEEMEPVVEDINLERCLVPTNVNAKVQNGEYVEFSWDKAKTSDVFVVELYTNPELSGEPVKTLSIAKEDVPYLAHLEADMVYYFRVKAKNTTIYLEDSKWYVSDKEIQTSAIKSSLNPELVDRGPDNVTIKWDADPEVDHIRIEPALDGKSEFTRFDVTAGDISAGQATITGLNPSTYYVMTVHFKSADRGSVDAWTRPATEGFTKVTDAASFQKALADGATKIVVAYAEEPYEMGTINAKGAFEVVGESTAEGVKPVIIGHFATDESTTSFHIEDLSLTGNNKDTDTHVLVAGKAGTMESISMINCDFTEFLRGIYYDNAGVNVSGAITLDGINSSYVFGTGGDNFDIRPAVTIGSITIKNSTFNHGTRTVIRTDANVKVSGAYTIENCTFNALCTDNGNVIGGSNVQGIFAVKATCGDFQVKNNLFLNQNAWLIGSNTACKVPIFTKNYVFNCCEQFFNSAKADGSAARTDLGESVILANGGLILDADPCVDSEGEKFFVTNASVIENNVGDPRWFMSYVEVPEDLTLDVTVPVKTWDFTNGKVFYKQADKDMVRDGIRFFVKESPVIFDASGFQFTKAATLADGIPADCGIGFKVAQAGSVVVSTAENGDPSALLTISLDGKPVIGVPAGENNYQYTFADLNEGEEKMIYIYGTGAITLTFLQWNNDTETDGPKILDTPAISLDKSSVAMGAGEDVTVSWAEIAKAGAYEVTVNGKTEIVTGTSYAIPTGSLKDWKYLVSVKAVPADDDMIRQESETAVTSFTIVESGINTLPGEKIWDAAFFEKLDFAYNTDEQGNPVDAVAVSGNVFHDNLAFMSNGKVKFGKFNEIPVVQSGGGVKYGTQACLQIKVGGNGTLTLKYQSTGDAGRYLSIANGSTVISEKVYEAPAKAGEPAVAEIPVSAVDGDLINIGGSGNLYFYEIKWTPSGAVEKTYTWDFSADEWKTKLAGFTANTNYSDWNFEVNGLNVVCNGGSMKWNNSDDVYFIQPGGKSDGSTRYLSFIAPASGTLKVWASNTGSSEDLTRMVTVKAGDQEPVSVPGGYSTNDGAKETSFSLELAGPTEVKIYPTGNGLRFYKVEFTFMESTKVVEDFVWDFGSAGWQEELAKVGASGSDITNWNLTYDGLNFTSPSKSKYGANYIQTGGKGSLADRVFTFTCKGDGYLYVKASNTGGSEDLTRLVAVQVGDDASTLTTQPGGYANSNVQELEFKVGAGDIHIYPSGNGLRFYSIEFHTDKK